MLNSLFPGLRPKDPKPFKFGGAFKEMVLRDMRREAIQKYRMSSNSSVPKLSDFNLPSAMQEEPTAIEIKASQNQDLEKSFFLSVDEEEKSPDTPSSKVAKIALRKYVPSIESNPCLRNYIQSKNTSPYDTLTPTRQKKPPKSQKSKSRLIDIILNRKLTRTMSQPTIQYTPKRSIKTSIPKPKLNPYRRLDPVLTSRSSPKIFDTKRSGSFRSTRESPKVQTSRSHKAHHHRSKPDLNSITKKINFPKI